MIAPRSRSGRHLAPPPRATPERACSCAQDQDDLPRWRSVRVSCMATGWAWRPCRSAAPRIPGCSRWPGRVGQRRWLSAPIVRRSGPGPARITLVEESQARSVWASPRSSPQGYDDDPLRGAAKGLTATTGRRARWVTGDGPCTPRERQGGQGLRCWSSAPGPGGNMGHQREPRTSTEGQHQGDRHHPEELHRPTSFTRGLIAPVSPGRHGSSCWPLPCSGVCVLTHAATHRSTAEGLER